MSGPLLVLNQLNGCPRLADRFGSFPLGSRIFDMYRDTRHHEIQAENHAVHRRPITASYMCTQKHAVSDLKLQNRTGVQRNRLRRRARKMVGKSLTPMQLSWVRVHCLAAPGWFLTIKVSRSFRSVRNVGGNLPRVPIFRHKLSVVKQSINPFFFWK